MSIFQLLFLFARLCFSSNAQDKLEIISLRSQLAFFKCEIADGKRTKPRGNNLFRRLWVFLSKNLTGWQSALVLVTPETVIGWHKRAFKHYWRHKSQGGRPKTSPETISLIKRLHAENPTLSPEKIHERLVALNIADAPAPNTIAKYIRHKPKPPTEKQKQSWQTFLHNHATGIWSMDFFTVSTLTFRILYVLIIISHERRKIEYFAVTDSHATAQWVIQQIRNATSFGQQPKYLIHDNAPVFRSKLFRHFLSNCNIKSKRIAPFSPWQNGICERLVGIVRRELLDYIIPLNQRHLECLMKEYVEYYNNVRTHQTLDCETPIRSIPPPITSVKDTVLSSKPILGGLYHSYDKHVCQKAA